MAITINQIAEICGVSRGTVDRALNNKGNVRPEVCARIKGVAAEHGYTPNRAGRALVRSRKPMRIGVLMHSAATDFVQMLLGHVQEAAGELSSMGVQIFFRMSDGMDVEEMLRHMDALVSEERIEGLAIMPLAHLSIQEKINHFVGDLKLPVVTLNSDLPGSRRMCYVGQDNVAAGRTAAGLMGLMLQRQPAKILPITGHSSAHVVYNERLFGFTGEMHVQYPHLTLLPMQNCQDNNETARALVRDVLELHPDLSGIYVASTGYAGTCSALIEAGVQHRIRVIAHDLTRHNLMMAKEQVLDFVIGQGVHTQGTLPLKILQDILDSSIQPDRTVYQTAIEVRFHYNIPDDAF